MLLPREQASWNCGYVLGAIALKVLTQTPSARLDLLELQTGMSTELDKNISATQALAAATWLFLLDAIELNDDGTLEACS